ncbi:FAD-binding monooxygenase [Flagelloscypha sp. PMI_526]|nr:FAD-binding monooxygenase [Flagelloscypha sp. PMI_526]
MSVGSGPTGLACALALAQNGIPVRIIEKLTQRPQSERATAIMPRTLEMYHFLGVLDDVLKEARLPPRCFSYAQGSKDPNPNFELFPTDVEPTPARPMPSVVFLGQHRQEAIMREHLAQFSCTVEYDLELVDIEQYSDHAVGILRQPSGIRERMETPYIVGADGPQSTLRQRLELDFPIPGVKKLITGEVTVSSGLQHQSWYFWGSPTSILLTLRPLPNPGTFSLICGGPELDMSRIVTSSDTFLSLFRKVTGREDVVFGRVEGLSEYSPHTISAKTWKVGRCFIAGDAAHGHSPVLSHGLNLGIQDAVNLGWKLASVLKRISSPTLA